MFNTQPIEDVKIFIDSSTVFLKEYIRKTEVSAETATKLRNLLGALHQGLQNSLMEPLVEYLYHKDNSSEPPTYQFSN